MPCAAIRNWSRANNLVSKRERCGKTPTSSHRGGHGAFRPPNAIAAMSLLTFSLIFLVGLLIGAVGIGGFLVVPVLVFLEGRSFRDAVIAATVSFLGSGLVSLFVWMRHGRLSSNDGHAFLLTTVPGALAGALLLRVISGTTIGLLIAFAVGVAGLAELFGLPRSSTREPHPIRAIVNGLISGLGSALTGTSGPLIAMPMLAWANVPILERIRIGQVAQLPIAATAAVVFIYAGDIAWLVAGISAFALAAGGIVGMRFGMSLPPIVLSRTAACLMLLTACSMLASVLHS